MAGYYIQGLLNTETAWDSYCIYGYKSDIDKRYFCAVQTSNVFYASRRESAYINVYIYCKGQQISTLKCISNTGSEYNVSTQQYSTADPTVTRIYEHDVWSNMNGRQTTIADFLSNAPILNGVNLSDAERDALAINYLNNVPEPYGQGTVTLSIKRPGQTLNFASRLLGKTVSQYISGDAVVDMNAVCDWEIMFSASYGVQARTIYINSDFVGKYFYPDTVAGAHDISGDLISEVNTVPSGGRFRDVVANSDIIGMVDSIGTADTSMPSGTYTAGDTLPTVSATSYARIVIGKKVSVSMPFEIGFHWDESGPAESAILKRDGTYIGWVLNPIVGEYLTVYNNRFVNSTFNGTLKCFVVYDIQTDDSGEWLTLDASTANTITAPFFIVFAIPS